MSSTQDFISDNRKLQRIGYKKGLTMASLNVNGLRNNLDEVKILMTDLGIAI